MDGDGPLSASSHSLTSEPSLHSPLQEKGESKALRQQKALTHKWPMNCLCFACPRAHLLRIRGPVDSIARADHVKEQIKHPLHHLLECVLRVT